MKVETAPAVRAARRTMIPMPSLGETLRTERQKRQTQLDEIARETRVQQHYLVALEEGDLSSLPGTAFNKGFVRSYAEYLGLDPEALVQAYTEEEEAQTRDGKIPARPDLMDELRETVKKRGVGKGLLLRRSLRLVLPAVVGLSLVALALWFIPPRGRAPEPPPSIADGSEAGMASGSVALAPAAAVASREDTPPPSRESKTMPTVGVNSHGRLSISESGVGTGVTDRQLEGESDRFAEGSTVFFWTRVIGGQADDELYHVWIHDGRTAGSAMLSVGGPHWRTHSRQFLPAGSAGRWRVEARDAEGRVLASQVFLCEPASPARE